MSKPSDIMASELESLGERLKLVHNRILKTVRGVDRIGCALYERADDLLVTFINSTRSGEALSGYEFNMSGSRSLQALAESGNVRLIRDIPSVVQPDTPHSAWLLKEGYKSSLTVPMLTQGSFAGFVFFDSKQQDAFKAGDQETLLLHANLISMLISNELLSIKALVGTVGVARAFCELRDHETGAHLERMSRYSRLIARDIAGEYGLDDEFVEHVFLYAPLHDVGKIGIPDRILMKPGKLDAAEWEIMKSHVNRGREVMDKIIDDLALHALPDVDVMRNIVEHHHECLDGSGYPDSSVGSDIPIEARITTVADIFDALTTRRPYKEPWPVAKAFDELERLVSLGKVDGFCVQALKRHSAEVDVIRGRYVDA